MFPNGILRLDLRAPLPIPLIRLPLPVPLIPLTRVFIRDLFDVVQLPAPSETTLSVRGAVSLPVNKSRMDTIEIEMVVCFFVSGYFPYGVRGSRDGGFHS